MDLARAQEIKRLFEAAVGLPTASQRLFLDDACGDDFQMRVEVDTLLVAERRRQAAGSAERTLDADRIPPAAR